MLTKMSKIVDKIKFFCFLTGFAEKGRKAMIEQPVNTGYDY